MSPAIVERLRAELATTMSDDRRALIAEAADEFEKLTDLLRLAKENVWLAQTLLKL